MRKAAAMLRCWDDHVNDMRLVGKRLLWDHEFTEAADGSPEKVAVKGAAQPNLLLKCFIRLWK